jgi:hypothetical protein
MERMPFRRLPYSRGSDLHAALRRMSEFSQKRLFTHYHNCPSHASNFAASLRNLLIPPDPFISALFFKTITALRRQSDYREQ